MSCIRSPARSRSLYVSSCSAFPCADKTAPGVESKNKAKASDECRGGAQQKQPQQTERVAAATQIAVPKKVRSSLPANRKTLWKTISVFLGREKRNSGLPSKSSESSLQGKRRSRNQQMDELSGKMNPKFLENLRKKTRFSKDEVEALCRIYRKLASKCQFAAKTRAASSSSAAITKPCAAEGIDRIVFREMLHSTFDIVTEELIMERIFCSWDKAHEGLPLRLEGWLTGLSVFLRGTPAERAAFSFRVYDLNGDGFIAKDEMFTLLRNCLLKQPRDEDPDEGVKDLVEIILKKFDLDKDGKVSLKDFLATVTAEPLLIETFGQCLPTESAVVSFLSTL